MLYKILVSIVLVVLVQGTQSTSVTELLSSLEPKITSAKDSVRRTTDRSSNTISNSHIAIDNIVRSGSDAVYKQLSTLKELVNQEMRPGRNIINCVNEMDNEKATLNLHNLQICRDSPKWNEIGNKLAELVLLEHSVISSPNNCFAQFGVNTEKLNECILNSINEPKEKADAMFKEIGASIGEIRNTALTCVHAATIPLRVSIDTITRNFNSCVNAL